MDSNAADNKQTIANPTLATLTPNMVKNSSVPDANWVQPSTVPDQTLLQYRMQQSSFDPSQEQAIRMYLQSQASTTVTAPILSNQSHPHSYMKHTLPDAQFTTNTLLTTDACSALPQWCEPFEKHELVEILVKISRTNPRFQSCLGHAFVTDLKWCAIRVNFHQQFNTNQNDIPSEDEIREYFTQYGSIHNIQMNTPQQQSTAILITFANYTYAQEAVSVGQHRIKNKVATCCYAFEQPAAVSAAWQSLGVDLNANGSSNDGQTLQIQNSSHGGNSNVSVGVVCGPLEKRRLFVSSLAYETTDETLMNVFSQYGELKEWIVVRDRINGRSKGYGFVVYKNVNGAENALEQPEKYIDRRRTKCWLAAKKPPQKNLPSLATYFGRGGYQGGQIVNSKVNAAAMAMQMSLMQNQGLSGNNFGANYNLMQNFLMQQQQQQSANAYLNNNSNVGSVQNNPYLR